MGFNLQVRASSSEVDGMPREGGGSMVRSSGDGGHRYHSVTTTQSTNDPGVALGNGGSGLGGLLNNQIALAAAGGGLAWMMFGEAIKVGLAIAAVLFLYQMFGKKGGARNG